MLIGSRKEILFSVVLLSFNSVALSRNIYMERDSFAIYFCCFVFSLFVCLFFHLSYSTTPEGFFFFPFIQIERQRKRQRRYHFTAHKFALVHGAPIWYQRFKTRFSHMTKYTLYCVSYFPAPS